MTIDARVVQLKKLVDSAIERMMDEDAYLIENDVSERCLCARLALHVARALEMSAYRESVVDVEYDMGLEGCDYAENRIGDEMIVVDLVVHKRGSQCDFACDNLIAIEVRKRSNVEGYGDDMAKLKRLTDPRYGFMYKLGVMVVADGKGLSIRSAFVHGRECAPHVLEIMKDDEVVVYHKLVRDKIPEVIAADGKYCVCETLNDADYIRMLDAKLNEELGEYQRSKELIELADLLEVMYAVTAARGWSPKDLELARAAKAQKRGGFEQRILLKEVRKKPRTLRDDADDLLGALASGIDPFTGEVLPEDHICQNPQVVMALKQVIRKKERAQRRRMRENEQKRWSPEEEEQLLGEYEAQMDWGEIAKNHGRTKYAIEMRLKKLGKISE